MALTAGYRRTVLGLLVAAYGVNFVDRTIISTVSQAIKEDLLLTDIQLGVLGGLAFASLYTLAGLPIARVAERANRVNIITASMIVWSAFTALCGSAQNFLQLLLFRMGVGLGEAGLTPPAHSIISDLYAPEKRATALSIFSLGVPIGALIGAACGGWLTQTFSWRVAMLVVGVPGIAIALLIKLFVRDPPRGLSDPGYVEPVQSAARMDWRYEVREIGATAAVLLLRWPALNIVLGATIASFATYGVGAFIPPFFLRSFDLDYAQVGLIAGVVAGISSTFGILVGGIMSDRLAQRAARWYALVPAFGLTLASPLYIAAFTQSSWQLAALLLLVPGVLHFSFVGPTYAIVQNLFDAHRRATATAVLFFFFNLIALGGGPIFTGWAIDLFAHLQFGAQFSSACPGGVAPAGATGELVSQCHEALSAGTRNGILVTVCLYAWAGLHFLIGSFGIGRAFAGATPGRDADSDPVPVAVASPTR